MQLRKAGNVFAAVLRQPGADPEGTGESTGQSCCTSSNGIFGSLLSDRVPVPKTACKIDCHKCQNLQHSGPQTHQLGLCPCALLEAQSPDPQTPQRQFLHPPLTST